MLLDAKLTLKATKLALEAVGHLTIQDTPVVVSKVAQRLGVTHIENRPMEASGLLVANGDDIAIYVRASDSPSRKRFTIAHEIGHLLLARAAGSDVKVFHRGRVKYSDEERMADRLAAEVLMPMHLLRQDFDNYKPNASESRWRFLQGLEHRYCVSKSTVVLRALEVDSITSILFRGRLDEAGQIERCSVDCSPHSRVTFSEPPKIILHRLLEDSTRTGRWTDVYVGEKRTGLSFDPLYREMRVCGRLVREHWLIGWVRR